MGEANRRGSYEQRKQASIEHNAKKVEALREAYRRRPSPKHTALMATIATALAEHPELAERVRIIEH